MAAATNQLLAVTVNKRQNKATTNSSLNLASTSSSPKVKRRNSSLGLQNLLMPWYKSGRKEKTSSKCFEEDETHTPPPFPTALNFLEDKPLVRPPKPPLVNLLSPKGTPVVPRGPPGAKRGTAAAMVQFSPGAKRGIAAAMVQFSPGAITTGRRALPLCCAERQEWVAEWDDSHTRDFYDDTKLSFEEEEVWTFQRGITLFRRQGFRRKTDRPASSIELRKYQQETQGSHQQAEGNVPDQVPLTRCSSLPPTMRLSTRSSLDNERDRGEDALLRGAAGSTSSDTVFLFDSHLISPEPPPEAPQVGNRTPESCHHTENEQSKNCAVCKCPREVHDVSHQEAVNVRDRLGLVQKPGGVTAHTGLPLPAGSTPPPPVLLPAIGQRTKEMSALLDIYTWTPPGLSPERAEEYMRLLPRDKIPKRSSAGERWRERQLAYQLPRQDLALSYCRYVEPQYQSSYTDFVAARNDIALDIGYAREAPHRSMTCYGCGSPIPMGALVVMAPKFGETAAWHPACFTCNACSEILVDLTHCIHDDQIYCERHYAEQLKPRCAACDELIFSGEYTKAMSKDWHLGHFSCWQCDESLTGQRYVLRDDHPYCVKCYETVFANTCDECSKLIGIDSKDLSYKERHWHEACFLCNKCRVSLVDKQFGSKADKIYCGPCYDSQFATRCDGCGEIFRAGTKKMEYKSRQWHEKCFCCCVCKTAIGTKSFIPRDQDIYCAGCYEEKFATRCVKCSKIITTGGVTYKNEPWHRECFTCTHCNTSLAGQRFTSRDEKPYCADCFGELFAKRCTACVKPITGIGGTRFISFEDRHWHNDCFMCASCTTSLVGKGFITDGADILCPECAKQRVL